MDKRSGNTDLVVKPAVIVLCNVRRGGSEREVEAQPKHYQKCIKNTAVCRAKGGTGLSALIQFEGTKRGLQAALMMDKVLVFGEKCVHAHDPLSVHGKSCRAECLSKMLSAQAV